MRRLTFSLATVLVAGMALTSAGVASAATPSTHVRPVLTATQATFTIPATPAGVWQMTLNTKNSTPNKRLGRVTGTSGTLTLAVPQTTTCDFQVDVKVQRNGVGRFHFYSGVVGVVPDCGVPCPQGTKVNFRWHYSANGSSGSWSGTQTGGCPSPLTMGPQAMEGDLKVSPGTTLKAGYDFTVPGNNTSFSVTVTNPQVVFAVACVSGMAPSASTFTVTMPTQSYAVPDSQWYPSGDQSSPLVYQGSIAVPDLCGGGQLRLNQGGTFSASVS
jgi:hypothetical protein